MQSEKKKKKVQNESKNVSKKISENASLTFFLITSYMILLIIEAAIMIILSTKLYKLYELLSIIYNIYLQAS